MDTILFTFVGLLCFMTGIRVYCGEERNKVFNKHSIVVKDVKKYNQICGALIIGFGVVAEITLYLMMKSTGFLSFILMIAMIGEAYLLVFIYNKVEKKCLER